MLNVAVIGLGTVSRVHLPIIKNNKKVKLIAVCDSDTSLNDHSWGVNFYSDYEEMLDKEALDIVHICLPHDLHLPVTKACAERNVHVYLEKPLADNIDAAKELVELEASHPELHFCVSLQNRYNKTVETLLEIANSKIYGDVLGVKGLVTWFRPESYFKEQPWRGEMKRSGGGVLINQAIHTLDLVQLFGGDIASIKASVDQLLDYDIDVEDTVSARIEFTSGATGLFFATLANSGNSSTEFQVVFEEATYTIKDNILTKKVEGRKRPLIEDEQLPGTKFYYGASHATLINRFYKNVINNTRDYVQIKDSYASMEMVDKIRESSEKQETIHLT